MTWVGEQGIAFLDHENDRKNKKLHTYTKI